MTPHFSLVWTMAYVHICPSDSYEIPIFYFFELLFVFEFYHLFIWLVHFFGICVVFFIMSIYCPHCLCLIHPHLIPFNKGGLIGPALLGARLSPPSSFLLLLRVWTFVHVHILSILFIKKSIYVLFLSWCLVRNNLVKGNTFSFSYKGPCTIVYLAVTFWVILWLILFNLPVIWLFVQVYATWRIVTL